MQIEKSSSISPVPQNLFQDRYGVLALAAHATLTKTPSISKVGNDLRLRLVEWTNSTLVIIKQLFWHNSISFFVWIEPDVLMQQTLWEEYLQEERKSHD